VVPFPSKVDAIAIFPHLLTVKSLQEFLGMVNFYHRFIPSAAQLMLPLYEALKCNAPKYLADWSVERDDAFADTKAALAHPRCWHTHPPRLLSPLPLMHQTMPCMSTGWARPGSCWRSSAASCAPASGSRALSTGSSSALTSPFVNSVPCWRAGVSLRLWNIKSRRSPWPKWLSHGPPSSS